MSAPDKKAGTRQPDAPEIDASGEQQKSFASLTRTLEDLEARLSRLSSARTSVAEKTAAPARQPSATVSLPVVEKPSVEPAAAPEAAAEVPPSVQRAKAKSPLDRRFGTIAGEVETLQMQGATMRLINDVASDLQSLRTEIRENASGVEQFEEVRAAFLDLRQLIEAREDKGRIGEEIAQILDRLSKLQTDEGDRDGIETLRSELDGIGGLVSQMAREETLASVNRRWDEFETRLSEQVALDNAAKRDLRAELERLRESVRSLATDEQVRAVEARWTEFEERYLDQVREQTEEQLTRILKGDLDALRTRLDELAHAPVPAAVQARLDSLEGVSAATLEAGFERLGHRIEELEATLSSLPDLRSIERLDQRMQGLAAAVEAIAARQDDPELEHFLVLEERLDEISQAIVASALREADGIDMAPIERIEARIADLATRVDTLTKEGKADALSERVAELAAKVDGLVAGSGGSEIGERLDAVTERFETLFAEHRMAAPDLSIIEERLEALSDRLDANAAAPIGADLVRSLEEQIRALSGQLESHVPGVAGPLDPSFERRMAAVERRLDEGREELLTVARTAADEAVRLMLANGSGRESIHVLQLSDDLRRLEALSRETDDRSLMVFEAVHATLVKIAQRLETIEIELAAETGPVVRRAPQAVPADLRAGVAPVFTGMDAARDEDAIFAPEPAVAESADLSAEGPRGLRGAISRRLQSRRDKKTSSLPETATDDVRPSDAAPVFAGFGTSETVAEDDRAQVEAPSLDAADSIVSREANRPLEPGSGAPDIASLIERVRQQQLAAESATERQNTKSDFIAAARKAAMAAAAEADAMRRMTEPADNDTRTAGERIAQRRKPILMAVGAVLLAMVAIPLGRTVLPTAGFPDADRAEELAAIDSMHTAGTAPIAVRREIEATAIVPERPALLGMEPSGAAAIVAERQVPATMEPSGAAPLVAERPAPETGPTPVIVAESQAPAAVESPATVESPPAVESKVAAALPAERAAERSAELATPAAYQPQPARRPAVLRDSRDEAIATAVRAPAPVDALLGRALAKLPAPVGETLPATPDQIGSTALVAAAEGGDAKAMFEVGLRLMEGHGKEPNAEQAFAWFTHAAKRGFAPAQYSVGTMLEKGNGVARITPAARDWYLLAARAGNVRAMHNLAVLYATGIEGAAEPETAARWFVAAAEHGMRDSQYNLGILYARGAGVPQDLRQSYKWFSIVGAAGDKDALSKRDTIAKSLAEEDRERIAAEAAGFQPTVAVQAANTVDIPPAWAEPAERTASVSAAPADVTRAIRNVQTILTKLGFDTGIPDGVVGERTTKAVAAFQKQNGMAETGEIDADLIRALLKRQDA